MKKSIILIAVLIGLISCKESNTSEQSELAEARISQDNYESFGAKISPEGSFSSSVMLEKFMALNEGDTIDAKFTTKVNSVCQSKGCWMVLELPGVDDTMVKFKEYGFFVPKDISGKEVIVRGKAFVEVVSVEDQKHFAKDAGKSIDEIVEITEPVKSFGFLADGVLIKK